MNLMIELIDPVKLTEIIKDSIKTMIDKRLFFYYNTVVAACKETVLWIQMLIRHTRVSLNIERQYPGKGA